MFFDFFKKNKKSEGSARMGSHSNNDSKTLLGRSEQVPIFMTATGKSGPNT